MLAATVLFALLAGGSIPTYPRPAITPTVSASAASQPATLSMPLQLGQHCPKYSSVCTSGEPSFSLTQIRKLAKVFGLKVMLTPASKDAAITLQLSNPAVTSGLAGIGMPALFIKKRKPYYAASTVLSLITQTSKGAYYTATPHLQLHTEHATLDMGAVPTEKLRLFFLGWRFPLWKSCCQRPLLPPSLATNALFLVLYR